MVPPAGEYKSANKLPDVLAKVIAASLATVYAAVGAGPPPCLKLAVEEPSPN